MRTTKKSKRKTMSKKSEITRLWNKAGKTMQDYFRAVPLRCAGKGKSCTGRANCMHHHFSWARSTALRLEPDNLVPLCTKCHFAFHNGIMDIKINYEKEMRECWGDKWEDNLFALSQNSPPKGKALKEWLKEQIEFYKT